MEQRAAQFAPFQALTGYKEQIIETSRNTTKKKILTEEEKIVKRYEKRGLFERGKYYE